MGLMLTDSTPLAPMSPGSSLGLATERYQWEVGERELGREKLGYSLSSCFTSGLISYSGCISSVVLTSSRRPFCTWCHMRLWTPEIILSMFSALFWWSWIWGSHSTMFSFCFSSIHLLLISWQFYYPPFGFLALPKWWASWLIIIKWCLVDSVFLS